MTPLTIREKEHWKNRIAERIEKRIDALFSKKPGFKEKLQKTAEDRAYQTHGLLASKKRVDRLQCEIDQLEKEGRLKQDGVDELQRNMLSILTKRPKRSISSYNLANGLEVAIKSDERAETDLLLEQSATGRKILLLRAEKENLLDTVWLATSGKQVKELWSHLETLLEIDSTKLQRSALAIEPVESE